MAEGMAITIGGGESPFPGNPFQVVTANNPPSKSLGPSAVGAFALVWPLNCQSEERNHFSYMKNDLTSEITKVELIQIPPPFRSFVVMPE